MGEGGAGTAVDVSLVLNKFCDGRLLLEVRRLLGEIRVGALGGRYRPKDAGFRLVYRVFEDEPEGAVLAPPGGALHSECISA